MAGCCLLSLGAALLPSVRSAFLAETKVVFTSPLKDQTVPEEQSVTLECELSKPDQKVQWLKNGKELKPDRKRGVLPKVEGTKHILTIAKALLEDTSEYTVKLKDQTTKGKLTVEGMSKDKKPVIVVSLVL